MSIIPSRHACSSLGGFLHNGTLTRFVFSSQFWVTQTRRRRLLSPGSRAHNIGLCRSKAKPPTSPFLPPRWTSAVVNKPRAIPHIPPSFGSPVHVTRSSSTCVHAHAQVHTFSDNSLTSFDASHPISPSANRAASPHEHHLKAPCRPLLSHLIWRR